MPDLLEQGRDREPRTALTWRRTRVVDALGFAALASIAVGAHAVTTHEVPARSAPPAAAPIVHGSRPNLDLGPGTNLRAATHGRGGRYERTPSAEGLRSAVADLVAQLCGGGAVDRVVQQTVSAGFGRADVVLTTRLRGVPTKERDETGMLSARLTFRRDGYEYAADGRSGACAG